MFHVLRTFTLVMLVLAVVGCGPGGDGGSTTGAAASGQATAAADPLAIVMTVDPVSVGTSTVTARISAGAEPLLGATVTVRGDMTHAGMAPALADLTEEGAGVYVTDGFALPMAGDWIVTLEVEAADGRKAKQETFVSVTAR